MKFNYRYIVQFLALTPLLLQGESLENQTLSGTDLWTKSEIHYLDTLEKSRELHLTKDIAYIYHRLAEVNLEQGQFEQAVKYIDDALTLYSDMEETTLTRVNRVDARILKGRLFGFLDDYVKAVAELLAVYDENRELRGNDDPETGRLYKHLGWHFGRLAILEIDTESQKALDATLAEYGETLDYLEIAQKFYKKGLETDIRILGDWNPETAKSYGLMGWILGDRGLYAEAVAYHQKALEIRIKCYTEYHPNTARSFSNIGWNYEQLGDLENAKFHYGKAVEIMEIVLPAEHPELEKNRTNLARVKEK